MKRSFDITDTLAFLESATLKKKLSTKTVFGRITPEFLTELGKDGSADIIRVVGQATGVKTGQSDLGPWVGFKGNFLAINLRTNEAFRSGRLFLPDVASELVEAALVTADAIAVNLAFDISIRRDESTSVGYIYEAAPLIPVQESDPLKLLISASGSEERTNARDTAKESKGKKATDETRATV